MEVLVILVVLGITVGILAEHKNLNFFLWAVYGFFLFPIALAHVIVTMNKEHERCGFCQGERVRHAKFCKCCGNNTRPKNTVDKYVEQRLAAARRETNQGWLKGGD